MRLKRTTNIFGNGPTVKWNCLEIRSKQTHRYDCCLYFACLNDINRIKSRRNWLSSPRVVTLIRTRFNLVRSMSSWTFCTRQLELIIRPINSFILKQILHYTSGGSQPFWDYYPLLSLYINKYPSFPKKWVIIVLFNETVDITYF